MSEIFLSYKREDYKSAKLIAELLTDYGYDVWWDIELLPGDRFADEIKTIITKAMVSIVLWSEKSVKSNYVIAEATIALDKKNLIPVRLDDCELPIPFGTIQTLDISNWGGVATEIEITPLISAIKKKIGLRNQKQHTPEEKKKVLDKSRGEAELWRAISSHNNQRPQEYKVYINKYGEDGMFSDLARIRILSLMEEQRQSNKITSGKIVISITAVLTLLISSFQLYGYFSKMYSDDPSSEKEEESVYSDDGEKKVKRNNPKNEDEGDNNQHKADNLVKDEHIEIIIKREDEKNRQKKNDNSPKEQNTNEEPIVKEIEASDKEIVSTDMLKNKDKNVGTTKTNDVLSVDKSVDDQKITTASTPLDLKLFNAIKAGKKSIVKMYLKKNINIYAQDNSGMTALHIAINAKEIDILKMLLDKGYDVNGIHSYGSTGGILGNSNHDNITPLYLAVEKNCLECTKLLVKSGADVNQSKQSSGFFSVSYKSPLAVAAYIGSYEHVVYLVENGAEINPRSYSAFMTSVHSDRPLGIAIDKDYLRIVKYLLNNGAKFVDDDLLNSVTNGNVEITKMLVNLGANIFQKNSEDQSLLKIAELNKYHEISGILKNEGLDD